MKLLLSVIACYCFLFVGIEAQILADFSAGVAEIRALLGIAQNVLLVPTFISSGVKPAVDTNTTVTSNNILIRFELRSNSWPVYDAGVTAEFFTNGSFARLWSGRSAEITVQDNGTPRISSRRALYILARKFELCSHIKEFQNKQFQLLYLMNTTTKVGRLIYRSSVVLYGRVTSLGNETTETVQPTALIDANTGEVIKSWNGFTAQFVTTRKISAFGGNVGNVLGQITYSQLTVGLQADGRCIYSTTDVQVQDMASNTDSSPFLPTSFACDEPKSSSYDNANGGYSPLNDAMNNGQTTVNMYRAYVNGILQGALNLPVKLRIHVGVNYANAYWDGTYANFGDGAPSSFYPLVTLDNVAHEIGHSFTALGKGLEAVGEAGGINEAFSDMSGQAAVFFSGRTPNMMPGKEFTKNGAAVRDMCNPPSDKASIDNYSQYKPGMDQHYSSGLYNKAFCILSRLGGYWNVSSAFQVFAYANRMSWTANISFNEAVCGVQNAAGFILAPGAVADVSNAFKQVGLACNR